MTPVVTAASLPRCCAVCHGTRAVTVRMVLRGGRIAVWPHPQPCPHCGLGVPIRHYPAHIDTPEVTT